ncbi:MAG: ABC transporter transmembrane domain-containing protein [Chthoniobacteraceae bacterium]
MPENAEAKTDTRADFREMLSWAHEWRWQFRLAVFALMISMGFGLFFPLLIGKLVDAAVPSVKILAAGAWQPGINAVALVLLGTLAAQAVLTFFYSLSFQTAGQRTVVALRKRLYGRLIALPMKFFGEHRVGELASRLGSDMTLLEDFFCSAVPQGIRQGMLLLGGLVAIFLTSPRLAGLMLLSFPVFIVLAVIFGRSVRKISRAAQDRLAEGATVVEETLQGIASVKAFGNEGFERARHATAMDAFLAAVLRGARNRAALIAFIILGIFGSIVLVMWYGARLMHDGELTHGELTKFTLYTLFIGGGVSSIAEVIGAIQKGIGASQRVRELLAEPVESDRRPAGTGILCGHAAAEKALAALRTPPTAMVSFDDVHFRYPSRPDLPVLRGVTLEAKPGERIALVGPSGAGKSTIISLLLRFYEPDTGRILIGSEDARTLNTDALRARMAIVPQEVLLFGGTIRENIAYGRPGATDAEIRDAAQRANCAEFIAQFPEGFETLVGDRGVKLSGGQRQRVAIARAFIRNPDILLLDEATSSLDSGSEKLIQDALETLLAGRTAFIIAHRLATVRQCDRICVLEAGRVTESGTHDELIAREGGTYRRLAEMQFTG